MGTKISSKLSRSKRFRVSRVVLIDVFFFKMFVYLSLPFASILWGINILREVDYRFNALRWRKILGNVLLAIKYWETKE